MALRKDYKQGDGTVVIGYYRVRELHTQYEKDKGSEVSQMANFQLEVFNNETGDQINDEETRVEEGIGSYDMTLSATAPVTSLVEEAYTYLKSLELFKDAEDC